MHCGPFSNLNLNWTTDHFSQECFFFVVCSPNALIRPIQTHWGPWAYTNAHKLLCVKQRKHINLWRICDFFFHSHRFSVRVQFIGVIGGYDSIEYRWQRSNTMFTKPQNLQLAYSFKDLSDLILWRCDTQLAIYRQTK